MQSVTYTYIELEGAHREPQEYPAPSPHHRLVNTHLHFSGDYLVLIWLKGDSESDGRPPTYYVLPEPPINIPPRLPKDVE